ncbi:MAG: efflux RND transporter periplasmic adaptor subunit [Alphaproteobacteria bacterium]|nr:MAG: efflux RND transporter periplasmic adaptor subunit [Alphaproteobacteria bacterium]
MTLRFLSARAFPSRVLTGAVAAALLAGVATTAVGAEDAPADPASAALRPVASIILGSDRAVGRGFVGTVAARLESDLGFSLSGTVAAREVDIGDEVLKGDVIARLDPEALEADVWAARAGVIAAEQQLASARDARQREQALVARGVESAERLEDAERQLAAAEARLEQARAALAQAEDRLRQATLVAPHDGVVTKVFVEPGAAVSTGTPIVRLAAVGERELVVDMTEADLAAFGPDSRPVTRLLALPDTTATLALRTVDPVADPRARTRRAHFTLIDPPAAFRIGALATLSLPEGTAGALILPAEAVVEDADGPFVWVVTPEPRRVRRAAVTTAPADATHVIVTGGVAAGQEIVVKGVHSLSEGQPVGPRWTR